jgi:hypothetical protein
VPETFSFIPALMHPFEPSTTPFCWLDNLANNVSNYFGTIGTIAKDGLSINADANICTATEELRRQTRAVRIRIITVKGSNNINGHDRSYYNANSNGILPYYHALKNFYYGKTS